jgi:hypothetical protein
MTKRDNVSWRPRVTASSRSFAGHRAQVSWMSEDFPQGGSLEAKAETRPPCPGGAPYSSRGQRPRKVRRSFPDPARVESRWRRAGLASRKLDSYDPFRAGPRGGRVFRGRRPRLLYQSPSGIVRISRTPCPARTWDMLSILTPHTSAARVCRSNTKPHRGLCRASGRCRAR